MRSGLLSLSMAEWGLAPLDDIPAHEARSGASVVRVRTRPGASAFLKVADGDAAERELRFYRDVAPRAPVRTPALIDAMTTHEGVALLLDDAGTRLDARDWSETDWALLGRELAELHTMRPSTGDWTRPDGLLAALAAPDLDRVTAFWAGQPGMARVIDSHTELLERLLDQPEVFVHGDCHTDNVLHHGDGIVFCDWQSAGMGRASSDLAFVRVRATPSGTAVPAAMLHTYLRRRAELGLPTDQEHLERDVDLEELAILVLQWPQYAALNTDAAVDRVRARAATLAALPHPPA